MSESFVVNKDQKGKSKGNSRFHLAWSVLVLCPLPSIDSFMRDRANPRKRVVRLNIRWSSILSNERVSSGVISNHVLNDILKRATYAEHAVGPIV